MYQSIPRFDGNYANTLSIVGAFLSIIGTFLSIIGTFLSIIGTFLSVIGPLSGDLRIALWAIVYECLPTGLHELN